MSVVQPKSNRAGRTHRSRKLAGESSPSEVARPTTSVSYCATAETLAAADTGVSLSDRLGAIRQHGDFTMAYSTAVQPRLIHFGDGSGYIAHRARFHAPCALGDPVCEPAQRAALIDRFVAAHPRPMFCQVSQPVAKILHERGYWINPMGIDTTLHLADYNFGGKKKEWLRYAGNWISRRGYEIVEASFDEVTTDCVIEISEAWRQTRTVKQKEVRFLNRPIVMVDEPDVRKFFLRSAEGKILAFVFLDPLYRDGQIIGYATSFKRRHPDAPQYGEQAIMKHVIETLQAESVAELKLGLSPLANLAPPPFRTSRMTHWLFEKTFASRQVNRWFYHVAGHADYKRRFYGTEEPCYLAMPTRFSPRRLAALIGLCGIA